MAKTAPKIKGPGGRPKKVDHERKLARLETQVTLAEKQLIREQRIKAGGISEAEYVRRRCLYLPIIVPQSKIDATLLHELNALVLQLRAIGNNVNQIALNRNSGRHERQAWQEVLKVVNQRARQASQLLNQVADNFK